MLCKHDAETILETSRPCTKGGTMPRISFAWVSFVSHRSKSPTFSLGSGDIVFKEFREPTKTAHDVLGWGRWGPYLVNADLQVFLFLFLALHAWHNQQVAETISGDRMMAYFELVGPAVASRPLPAHFFHFWLCFPFLPSFHFVSSFSTPSESSSWVSVQTCWNSTCFTSFVIRFISHMSHTSSVYLLSQHQFSQPTHLRPCQICQEMNWKGLPGQ